MPCNLQSEKECTLRMGELWADGRNSELEVQQWAWDGNNLIAKEVSHHVSGERRLEAVVGGCQRNTI